MLHLTFVIKIVIIPAGTQPDFGVSFIEAIVATQFPPISMAVSCRLRGFRFTKVASYS